MLRLTRTAIGLLTAQYRSVLRKCWAINVGVFGLMGKAAAITVAMIPSVAEAEQTGDAAIITDGTSSDYNYIVYEDGTLVYKKVKFDKDYIHQSNKISWSDMATSGTVTALPISYNTGIGKASGTIYVLMPITTSDVFNPQSYDQYYTYTYTKPSGYTTTNTAFANAKGSTTSISGKMYYSNDFTQGAVYNLGTLTSVSADFVGNKSTSTNYGGAFTNNNGTTTSIVGDFVGNAAFSGQSGGAILNYSNILQGSGNSTIDTITGDFIGNSVSMNQAEVYGGAINNYASYNSSSLIGTIRGDFTGNTASFGYGEKGKGGAISNYAYPNGGGTNLAKIDNIYGDFSGNIAQEGGAIYMYGRADGVGGFTSRIGSIVGDFVGNKANLGAAIYMRESSIDSIVGDFIGNNAISVSSSGTTVRGQGVIYMSGNIGSIVGDFIDNYGTAIWLSGTIDSITGDFIGNSGEYGAIFSSGSFSLVDSSFISNLAYREAGAIYLNSSSTKTSNIYAKTKDVKFYDNRISSPNQYADISMSNSSNLNLGAASDKSISFGGTIKGINSTSNLNLNTSTDDGYHGGSYNFYNTISGVTFNMGSSSQSEAFNVKLGSIKQSDGSTTYGSFNDVNLVNNATNAVLDSINNHTDTNALKSLNLQQALKLNIDVETVSGASDNITLTDSTINGEGNLIIDKINVLPQKYGISVADDNVKGRVELSEALQNGDFSGVIGADVKSVEYDSETGMLYLEVPFGSSGGGTWGSITGTITDQTDLMKHLNNNYYRNNKKSEILGCFEGWKTGNKITNNLSKCHAANDNFVSKNGDFITNNLSRFGAFAKCGKACPEFIEGKCVTTNSASVLNHQNIASVDAGTSLPFRRKNRDVMDNFSKCHVSNDNFTILTNDSNDDTNKKANTFAIFAKVPVAELRFSIANETSKDFAEMSHNSPTGEDTFLFVSQTHKNVLDNFYKNNQCLKASNDNFAITTFLRAI
ncbi:MAG: hypothetical protein J6N45_00110 [Alphaproteobacteria bacterium]|nr:hypothetical protein [Alphaproteobacteria bacterium]